MLVRIVVLVLAVMMVTGSAGEVCASPDVASAIDDASSLDPPLLPVQVTVVLPDAREPVPALAPLLVPGGRMHAAFVFRPPRLVASR